jgi:phosphoribosylaminoimidazole (AIR) synthetase
VKDALGIFDFLKMADERDTAEYEKSEAIAIAAGKKAFAESPGLFNRRVGGKGFFAELRWNEIVHPEWYSVHCVDGVGTKLFFAPWSGDFSTQMLDGIEMNANDMATLINAYPSEVNVYIACQTPVEEQHMGAIAEGIRTGLKRISWHKSPFTLNLGKLETASLDEMINLGVQGKGFDVGFVMVGYIHGLHSNAFTGARHVVFVPDVEYRPEWKGQYKGKWQLEDAPGILKGQTIMQAMMKPTASYLAEANAIGDEFDTRRIYGVNITGNGLHNFNRAGENVSFHITDPLPLLPIHEFLIQESGWDPEKSYKKQNLGMGFGYVVPKGYGERVAGFINNNPSANHAKVVGKVKQAEKSQKELVTFHHAPYDGGGTLKFEGYTN